MSPTTGWKAPEETRTGSPRAACACHLRRTRSPHSRRSLSGHPLRFVRQVHPRLPQTAAPAERLDRVQRTLTVALERAAPRPSAETARTENLYAVPFLR